MFICTNCDSELKDEEFECKVCGYQFELTVRRDAEYLSETKLSNIIKKYSFLFDYLNNQEIETLINIPKNHSLLVNYKEELIILNFLILYCQLYFSKLIINNISLYSYRNKSFAIKILRKIKLKTEDKNINNIIKARNYLYSYPDLSDIEKDKFIRIEDILLENNIIVKDKNKLALILYSCIKEKELNLGKETKQEKLLNVKIIDLIKLILSND